MKHINIRKITYFIKNKLLQRDVGVLFLGTLVGLYFVWNAVIMIDRNYNLQKQLDAKVRELEIARLETASLELEKRYLTTAEYQELVARESLGLALPGEKLLVLPANSEQAISSDRSSQVEITDSDEESNLQKWINFLSGKNVKDSVSD